MTRYWKCTKHVEL